MYKVKVTSKGQITIPKKLRDKMGIICGDYLNVRETKEGYVIEKQIDVEKIKKYVGILNKKDRSDKIVKELRGNGDSY